jgi:hypothetical protein
MPFGLAPGRDLKDLDEPVVVERGPHVYRLSRDGARIALSVIGLPSEAQAVQHIDAVWRGLVWCLLELGVGFDVDLRRGDVMLREEPFPGPGGLEGEFHGLAAGDGPSIFATDKRIGFVRAGLLTATVSNPAAGFLGTLVDGIEQSHPAAPPSERMRTALDLLRAHYYEQTARAQLLTLATALEALAEPRPKAPEAQELLDRWEAELTGEMEALDKNSPTYLALESLGRDLIFRRDASIRSRVRQLPADVLGSEHEEVPVLSAKAVRAYDARSTLVHTGTIEGELLRSALEDGRHVLKELLKVLLAAKVQNVSR